MDRIAITGGARLEGEIPISGAKNSAIKLMAASLLTDEPLRLTNMPRLADTRFLGQLLQRLGTEVVERDGRGRARRPCCTRRRSSARFAPYDLVRQMRASFNVLGPLLARTGQAKVSLPGGCAIGARPVDLHLKALEALGARIDLHEGYVYAQAPRGLKGAQIDFPFVSVGATEHAMLAAVLAEGETVLDNAACEPEIDDLADCLNAMGAKVEGAGTSTIRITGRRQAARRDPRGDARPDRDRHLRAGRGHGRRRGAADPHPQRLHPGPARQDGRGRRRGDRRTTTA